MTFDKTGRVHYDGIQNEIDTIAILQAHGILNENARQIGGTKSKMDVTDGIKKVSAKQKTKGIGVGSFDWVNTSNVKEIIGDVFDQILSDIKEYRKLPETQRSSTSLYNKVKKEFSDVCSTVLDSFTADYLSEFLDTYLVKENEGITMAINDVLARKMYVYESEQHPAVHYLSEGFKPILKGKAKNSRRLLFTDGTKEYDCGLRVRVTSNNGINAFLGLSKANTNSQVVFKLQQDKVHKLMEMINAFIYEY